MLYGEPGEFPTAIPGPMIVGRIANPSYVPRANVLGDGFYLPASAPRTDSNWPAEPSILFLWVMYSA
jgi:hypothetical protein